MVVRAHPRRRGRHLIFQINVGAAEGLVRHGLVKLDMHLFPSLL